MRRSQIAGNSSSARMRLVPTLACATLVLVMGACGTRVQDTEESGSGDSHPECEDPTVSQDEAWATTVYRVFFSEGVPSNQLDVDARGVGECAITGFSDGVAPDEETALLLVHMDCSTVEALSDNMSFDDPVTLAIATTVSAPKIASLSIGAEVTISFAITAEPEEGEEEPSRNYGRVEHDGEVLAAWGSEGRSYPQPTLPPPVELEMLPYDLLPVEPWYPFDATSEGDVCPSEVVLEECWSIERLGYRFDDGTLVLDRRPGTVSAAGVDYSVLILASRLSWLVGYEGCPSVGETNYSSYELRAVAI